MEPLINYHQLHVVVCHQIIAFFQFQNLDLCQKTLTIAILVTFRGVFRHYFHDHPSHIYFRAPPGVEQQNYKKLYCHYACISGFPRGCDPRGTPGTEGRLLRLTGNFIPGVAGLDSLLTTYGLHPRDDPGDLFDQRLNLQKSMSLPVTKWRNER